MNFCLKHYHVLFFFHTFKRVYFDCIYRYLPEDFMEYQAVVKIPKEMLVKPVYYTYYVIRNRNECVNEYIYNHAYETNCRTLIHTEQNRKRGNKLIIFSIAT